MSINSSIPKMIKIGQTGIPKDAAVPNNITKEARGTPATPLLVNIKVKTINNCCPKVKGIPAACATKIAARAR